jgi:Sulfotransferase family
MSAVSRTEAGAPTMRPMQAPRVPDFFIVGHPRSGTTALWEMLRQHPDIFMPDEKEPRFFAEDLRSRFPPRGEVGRRLLTLNGYLSLFADAGPSQRVGEASPNYLRSRVAATNIAALRSDARIIAILREPTDFLRSFHAQMMRSNGETQRDLRSAIALEPARRQGRRIPRRCRRPEGLLYREHIRYVEQLRRFHEMFGRDQVLTLIYDDFRADNIGSIRSVLRFLDVDDTAPGRAIEAEPVAGVRVPAMHRLAGRLQVARANPEGATRFARQLNAIMPDALRSAPVRRAWRRVAYTERPVPDAAFVAELRVQFRPEVEALSEYLGRDLIDLWGYDRDGDGSGKHQTIA